MFLALKFLNLYIYIYLLFIFTVHYSLTEYYSCTVSNVNSTIIITLRVIIEIVTQVKLAFVEKQHASQLDHLS